MADSRQIEHAAATWLAKRSAAPLSPRERQAFDAWLNATSAHRVAYLRLEAAWHEADRAKALAAGFEPGQVPARGQWSFSAFGLRESTSASAAVRAASNDGDRDADAVPAARPAAAGAAQTGANPPPRRNAVLRFAGIAATLAVGVAAAIAWRWEGEIEQAQYRTAIGELQTLPLPDGSTLTLSSDSAVAVTLSRRQRLIELVQGEAIFEVAKDKARPFVVDATGSRVTAVGTRFAVRRSADGLRVVVTEGTVRLQPGLDAMPGQAESLLHAGAVAVLDRHGVSIRAGSDSELARLLDWQSGHLSFRDTTLAAAAAEFNRFNRRKLRIGDDGVAALRIGGHFRWANVEAFARLLEQGFPVRVEYRADEIVLHSSD
jgi:transmembrane sensor